ncbi:MAG: PLP-dependent aspartate aminotransferase family protein [bacterium]|jgi:cystathionine beta-lyase/cystathionine gamma-synthase
MHSDLKPKTIAVHAGTEPEPVTGAIMTPIFMTSTFVQEAPGVHKGYDYSRADNPTREAHEKALAQIERGCDFGLAFASGLAAEQAIIQTLNPGDRILVCDDVYGGTGRLFRRLYAKYNLDFQFIDMSDMELVKKTATPNTKLVWVESPTNPTMKVIDIAAMSKIAKSVGAKLVVDNTFASPVFQSPMLLGADIVMHSSTKYIGGHSDMIGGALMLKDKELYEQLKFVQFAAGAVPSPFESFMFLRSIKTLAVRMEQHAKNSQQIAEFLAGHKKVKKVHYPGLKTHPQHELAKRQMSGFSGMVSFDMNGTYDDVVKFLKKLKVFTLAESLGGVESLVNHPEKMTHASVPEELRKKLGIGPTMLRLSVGIEDVSDLVADLEQALA